jgi:putative copper export protein/methionine-rich copper-binding protein CopC
VTRSFASRAVATLAAAVVLLVLTAAAASAHAELVGSNPPSGATLANPPATVELRFDDAVQLAGSHVTVRSGAGESPLAALRLDGPEAIVADVPNVAALHGPVTFAWTVLADDGHPSSGVIDVGVGAGAPQASAGAPAVNGSGQSLVDRLFTIDRVIGYLALAVLVGGWVFLTIVWPEGAGVARTHSVLWIAWGAGLAATAAGLGLEAATVAGGRLADIASRSALSTVFATDFGHAWIARLVLFALAIPVLRTLCGGASVPRAPWWIVSAATVGVALLRTPGFASHASEGDMAVAGTVADLVHLIGVAIWLGGLVLLLTVVLPRRRPSELASVVPRFSKLAMASVIAIVAGGAVLSWELVGGFEPLVDTNFGRVLIVKLVVFGAVIVAAAASKRWVDDRLGVTVALRGHRSLVRPFVYSVAAETLLAASVVAVASVLVTTSPGT